jgi:hypothetical protein
MSQPGTRRGRGCQVDRNAAYLASLAAGYAQGTGKGLIDQLRRK